jgi:hypothetical protein
LDKIAKLAKLRRIVALVGRTITEQRDDVLHRISRVARIIEFQRRPVDQLALTGFERVDTTGDFTDFAKTWLCEEISPGTQ